MIETLCLVIATLSLCIALLLILIDALLEYELTRQEQS